MSKWLLILSWTLMTVLVGCEVAEREYTGIPHTAEGTYKVGNGMRVNIVWVESDAEMQRLWLDGGGEPIRVSAFTSLHWENWNGREYTLSGCTIYMMDPLLVEGHARQWRMQVAGHELMHCLQGYWHD